MITANELRIGNLVTTINRSTKIHLPTGITEKVGLIGLFHVELYDCKKLYATQHGGRKEDIYNLSPIPLTQDVIIKLGYESLQELISDMIHNAKHPISDNVGFWVATISGLRLHELQNLYFSITNNELTFK